jgi:hypothetical protein
LACAKVFAGAGQHDHARLLVVAQIREQIEHFAVQLRTHRVALFRTVERNRRYAAFFRHK